MFIVNLTYKVSLDVVNQHLEDHINYLDGQYEAGNFIASGRKEPRTGGIIISGLSNREELEASLALDPFHLNQLADYEVIEFMPSRTSDALRFLMK